MQNRTDRIRTMNDTASQAAGFPSCAREKLTKKFFLTIPEGYFILSNLVSFSTLKTAPQSEREAQWRSVPKGMRHRLCWVYKNNPPWGCLSEESDSVQPGTDEQSSNTQFNGAGSQVKRVPLVPSRKLTKKYFLGLPEGTHVSSNMFPRDIIETGPMSERLAQWQNIPTDFRYRNCMAYVLPTASRPLGESEIASGCVLGIRVIAEFDQAGNLIREYALQGPAPVDSSDDDVPF